jgi:hypothetical protein
MRVKSIDALDVATANSLAITHHLTALPTEDLDLILIPPAAGCG